MTTRGIVVGRLVKVLALEECIQRVKWYCRQRWQGKEDVRLAGIWAASTSPRLRPGCRRNDERITGAGWGETGSVRAPRARLWLSDAREQPTPSWAAGGLDLRLCNRCRALAYHTRAPCLSLPVGTGIRERATGDRDGTRSDKSAKRALSFWNTSERGERAPKTFLLFDDELNALPNADKRPCSNGKLGGKVDRAQGFVGDLVARHHWSSATTRKSTSCLKGATGGKKRACKSTPDPRASAPLRRVSFVARQAPAGTSNPPARLPAKPACAHPPGLGSRSPLVPWRPPLPPWCPWTPPARRPWLVRSHPSIVPSPFWRQSIASDPHPSAASFVCLAHSRRMAWAPSFRVSVAPSPICPVAAQRWPAWAAAWPDRHEYSHSTERARVRGRSPLHFPVHCAVSRTWLKYGASVPARREVLCSENRSGVIRGRHELLEYAPPRLVFEREELAWTSVLVQSTSHKVRYLTVRHSTRNTLSVLVRVLASLIRPSPPPVRRGKNRQERQEQEQHLLQPFEAIRSHLQAKRPSGQAVQSTRTRTIHLASIIPTIPASPRQASPCLALPYLFFTCLARLPRARTASCNQARNFTPSPYLRYWPLRLSIAASEVLVHRTCIANPGNEEPGVLRTYVHPQRTWSPPTYETHYVDVLVRVLLDLGRTLIHNPPPRPSWPAAAQSHFTSLLEIPPAALTPPPSPTSFPPPLLQLPRTRRVQPDVRLLDPLPARRQLPPAEIQPVDTRSARPPQQHHLHHNARRPPPPPTTVRSLLERCAAVIRHPPSPSRHPCARAALQPVSGVLQVPARVLVRSPRYILDLRRALALCAVAASNCRSLPSITDLRAPRAHHRR
ncbi:hypothetical protein Purlil1_4247 [Purpureocillium lilacinum]|uniref:Uncharacterized protein n=1 Tax=Purpureocillium lilacinum TaxID=33203 RepID=A0ABR0C678_PURLI|nr:hypothetical protein Purlil1_4247 [Purpureocillium lilacinum]